MNISPEYVKQLEEQNEQLQKKLAEYETVNKPLEDSAANDATDDIAFKLAVQVISKPYTAIDISSDSIYYKFKIGSEEHMINMSKSRGYTTGRYFFWKYSKNIYTLEVRVYVNGKRTFGGETTDQSLVKKFVEKIQEFDRKTLEAEKIKAEAEAARTLANFV